MKPVARSSLAPPALAAKVPPATHAPKGATSHGSGAVFTVGPPAGGAERERGGGRGQGRGQSHDPPAHPRRGTAAAEDPLDPATRRAAHLAPPPMGAMGASVPGHAPEALAPSLAAPAPGEAVPAVGARASVEDLLPALVRKVAWSGDGKRGTVRLELGSGAMAGAEVVIESDEGRVRVRLRGPAGCDLEAWRERVGARLKARGLDVEEVEAG